MRQLYIGMQNPEKSLLVIGTEEEAAEIQAELRGQCVAPKVQTISSDSLPDSLCEAGGIGAVCCASSAVRTVDLSALSDFCREKGVKLFFNIPELAVLQKNMCVRNVGFLSFLSLADEPLSHWWNRMAKRLFDLLVSGLFLLVVFPFVYIVAAIAIKRKSAGPVFSIHKETGKRGRRFERFVFRTGDFPAESFIRKSVIRQMPQFLNVFAGSMSVVGLQLNGGDADADSRAYMYAKPGLLKCQFCQHADVWYTQNWSLWLDVKIFMKTLLNKNRTD